MHSDGESSPRRWSELAASISYMKDKIAAEEESCSNGKEEDTETASSSVHDMLRKSLTSNPEETCNILRSLPGYSLGDPLRKEDKCLCCFEEAAAYAMDKFRPYDCGFVLRSDGRYTYSQYEGPSKEDPSIMEFRVNKAGHYKRVRRSQFCRVVKVPALVQPPVPLPLPSIQTPMAA